LPCGKASKIIGLWIAGGAEISESVSTLVRFISRAFTHTNQPWLSHPLIAGHWEERCRFGLEGFLELSSKLFSHNDGRVEGVVDYERSVEVWERLETRLVF